MIEERVKTYLDSKVTVPVLMEKPEDGSTTFVLIERTGMTVSNLIVQTSVALQSYAPTMYGAAKLDEAVRGAMDELSRESDIFASKLYSSYNHTNTQTKSYRYQSVYTIAHKEGV